MCFVRFWMVLVTMLCAVNVKMKRSFSSLWYLFSLTLSGYPRALNKNRFYAHAQRHINAICSISFSMHSIFYSVGIHTFIYMYIYRCISFFVVRYTILRIWFLIGISTFLNVTLNTWECACKCTGKARKRDRGRKKKRRNEVGIEEEEKNTHNNWNFKESKISNRKWATLIDYDS